VRQDPLILPGDQTPLAIEAKGQSIILTPREALDLLQALTDLLAQQLVDPNGHHHVYSDDYQTWLTVAIRDESGLAPSELIVHA
jgi:hypothetical protein